MWGLLWAVPTLSARTFHAEGVRMNGKGSKRRPSAKPGAYQEGWDRIFAKRARKALLTGARQRGRV